MFQEKNYCRKRKATKPKTVEDDNASVPYRNEPWMCSWCEKEVTTSEKDMHIRGHLYTPAAYGWKGTVKHALCDHSSERQLVIYA